jgi:hypothetical protein
MCLVGVLLTAQPTVLFGASGTTSISQTGIAVGITQVRFHHRLAMLSHLANAKYAGTHPCSVNNGN